jgi:1-acyl-sn-glycerol-3-phosphate acyltransferase
VKPVLAGSGGFGLLAQLGDLVARQRGGTTFLALEGDEQPLAPAALPAGEAAGVLLACLSQAGRLLLFPEGTRTRRERCVINRFRPGLALLAKQSGAPVLPVFISTDSPYLGKGWPIWRMPELPVSISIRVGEKLVIFPEERVREFSERLEGSFRAGLG